MVVRAAQQRGVGSLFQRAGGLGIASHDALVDAFWKLHAADAERSLEQFSTCLQHALLTPQVSNVNWASSQVAITKFLRRRLNRTVHASLNRLV